MMERHSLGSMQTATFQWKKVRLKLWINKTTHFMRQECGKAERKWKKDGLLIFLQILRDSDHYQTVVREEE